MRIAPEDDQRTRIAKKHDAAANAAATASVAADADQIWVVDKVTWSYSAAPTGGRITVQIGSTVEFDHDITAGGPGFFDFRTDGRNGLYHAVKNEAVVVTLAAGGGSVVGKVTVQYR